MAFDWNFRNYKRDPLPFLNGSIINDETARNAAIQNAAQNMQGYNPLASTIASEAMEGYQPLNPATQGQLAAGASQAMQGYTPNSVGRPSVPNDMHGGMAQPDLNGYGESLQAASNTVAQAQAKEQKIAELQSEISALETRIKENTAKLQNFTGNADKIAAIEARKIDSQDPTSIWRWKEGRDYQKALRAEELKHAAQLKKDAKAEQKQAFLNKLNATLPTMTVGLNTTPDQAQMYKNTLAGLEAEMANYGITDDRIAALKNSLYGDLPYNAMMSAIDELNEIDANYGKGSDYDRMNEDQKFSVYQKKLEDARQKLMDENPALWEMIQRDSTYRNKFNNLLSNRRPKSKGKEPVRARK